MERPEEPGGSEAGAVPSSRPRRPRRGASVVPALLAAAAALALAGAALEVLAAQRGPAQAGPAEDAAGSDYGGLYTPELERACCAECLRHGVQDGGRDCLDLLEEGEGLMQCRLALTEHPHTFFQCALAVRGEPSASPTTAPA